MSAGSSRACCRRREKEKQLAQQAESAVREHKDALLEPAKQAAQEIGDQLKPAAQEAVESVKSTAQDAAATVKDEGQSAAQDVQGQAQQSKEKVQSQSGSLILRVVPAPPRTTAPRRVLPAGRSAVRACPPAAHPDG